jgi:aerobic-type carbon monoxide dehydrogenase small subunit (CoxS/CutS family)
MTDPYEEEQAFDCELNGRPTRLVGRPAAPASEVLRARGLFSVRETCGLGVCGTCTILLDGEPVSTCITPLFALEGRTVRTAEGLEDGGRLSELQQQFVDSQAFQCSFCTPGFLLSGSALLERTDGELDDEAIEQGLQGHLCRCGCYETIKEAVRTCAARRLQAGGPARP